MAMHELFGGLTDAPLAAVIALAAGTALGLVFYAGLWWTVRRIATFRRPGLSVLTSLLLRMGVTLSGFLLVAGGDWARLLSCLMGFLLARAAVTWLTRLPSLGNGRIRATPAVNHAP